MSARAAAALGVRSTAKPGRKGRTEQQIPDHHARRVAAFSPTSRRTTWARSNTILHITPAAHRRLALLLAFAIAVARKPTTSCRKVRGRLGLLQTSIILAARASTELIT